MNKMRENIYKSQKGITLLALVITIIVLIILAGVGISLVTGDGGIIGKTKNAKETADSSKDNEENRLNEFGEYIDYAEKDQDYDKNITFNYSSRYWTNNNVTVTASATLENYEIQTSTDANTWDDETSQTLSENGNVYARLVNKTLNLATEYVVATVDNIDKVKPIITSVATTTNVIEISATDDASGIVGYAATESSEIPSNFTDCSSTNSLDIKLKNKTQGKTYYIWVKDAAGNISEYTQAKTGNVPRAEGNITFTYSSTTWTNKDVTVTVNTNIKDFKLKTSRDGRTWVDTTEYTLETNGKVYAKLIDSTDQSTGYAVATVDKIDKMKPEITSITADTNTIALKAQDDSSGIVGYAISESQEMPTNFTSHESTKLLDIKLENRTQGKTYYIWVKDAATNVGKCKKVQMNTVPKSEGNITFKHSSDKYTNQNITVTASTTSTGFKLQTSKDRSNWQDVKSQTLTGNGNVYARLVDSTNQSNGYAVTVVDKIDKIGPDVAITLSGEKSQTSLPATLYAQVRHTDNYSGMSLDSSRFVLNTSESKIGTESSSYTGGTFSSNVQNITLNPNSVAGWYLHVLSVDNAGNAKETIKGPITVGANYHVHSGNSSTNGGCYTVAQYRTETYTYQFTCGYKDGQNYWDGNRSCPRCGGGMWLNENQGVSTITYYCKGERNGPRTGTRQVLSGYGLSCGKTDSTVESYSINY